MVRRRTLAVTVVLACAVMLSLTSATAAPTTLLRLNGIGPLRLGMTRADAAATGWLAARSRRGCPLESPIPRVFRLTGPKAPATLRGFAEFQGGRLRDLSLTRGVRTAPGVVLGKTTRRGMVRRYRRAGFFAAAGVTAIGDLPSVTVRRRRHGAPVIEAIANKRGVVTDLELPNILFCE